MKRFLIVLLFLVLSFSFPLSILAETPTSVAISTAETFEEPSLWNQFWSWITGIFIKTDYTISQRPTKEVISDMNNYGNASESGKHSSSGTRLTSASSQRCYKGTVIKKVILDTSGYPNSDLSKICLSNTNECVVKSTSDSTDDLTNCQTITIKDLAHYFVQIQKQFYCDDQNHFINIDTDVITKVNEKFTDAISETKKICYQTIYNDFYLVPKDTADENEENSKKIVQTPISANEQVSSNNVQDNKNQLDKNFSPAGTSGGLNGLRPSSW